MGGSGSGSRREERERDLGTGSGSERARESAPPRIGGYLQESVIDRTLPRLLLGRRPPPPPTLPFLPDLQHYIRFCQTLANVPLREVTNLSYVSAGRVCVHGSCPHPEMGQPPFSLQIPKVMILAAGDDRAESKVARDGEGQGAKSGR